MHMSGRGVRNGLGLYLGTSCCGLPETCPVPPEWRGVVLDGGHGMVLFWMVSCRAGVPQRAGLLLGIGVCWHLPGGPTRPRPQDLPVGLGVAAGSQHSDQRGLFR
jgi:hypothetical protein